MALLSALDTAISRASIRHPERGTDWPRLPAWLFFQSQLSVPMGDNTDTKPPRHSTFKSWSDKIPQLSQAMVRSLLLLDCSNNLQSLSPSPGLAIRGGHLRVSLASAGCSGQGGQSTSLSQGLSSGARMAELKLLSLPKASQAPLGAAAPSPADPRYGLNMIYLQCFLSAFQRGITARHRDL